MLGRGRDTPVQGEGARSHCVLRDWEGAGGRVEGEGLGHPDQGTGGIALSGVGGRGYMVR